MARPIGKENADNGADERRIATVRGFNRFYTRQIGALRKTFLDSPYSLAEARVLYEIARGNGSATATEIGRALDLDAGYLSRLLGNFEKRGLIRKTASATDARQSHLTLTARGRKDFIPLDRRSQRDIGAMLGALTSDDQLRLIAAMTAIQTLLGGQADAIPAPERCYSLRAPRPGDFGWIVKRHVELYAQEYGWTEPFEGVCAQIVADFANKNDPTRERCWVAEMDGDNIGCVFLVADSDTVARIRLLLIDPKARGLGLGTRLVDECIALARHAGYKKITLWTHSILAAARRIYQQAGFTLTSSEERVSFGKPVVSEYWDLQL
jgi:DNA-binding MarR family transcriptional regulator/RimJ/RimL family protein N-acetyltransferase